MKPTEAPFRDPATDGGEADDARLLLRARDLTTGALLGALAIVLPIAFHGLGPGVGPIFQPMYLPILALGLMVSWEVALAVGCLAPIASALLTGMPPFAPPVAFLMASELAALAVGASLARRTGAGVWLGAVVGIVASRLAGAGALLTVGHALGYGQGLWQYSVLSFAIAWPGLVLQLAVVPAVVRSVESASVLGRRWRGPNR